MNRHIKTWVLSVIILASVSVQGQQNLKPPLVLKAQKITGSGNFVLTKKYAAEKVIFGMKGGKGQNFEGPFYDYWPVIQIGDDKIIELRTEFPAWTWTEIRRDEKRGHFYAILEYTVEGSAHQLPFIASLDNGKTWRYLSDIPKSHYTELFKSFFMDAKGHGEVLFEREEGAPLSRAATRNFGKTWKLEKNPDKTDLDQLSLVPFLETCRSELVNALESKPLPARCDPKK